MGQVQTVKAEIGRMDRKLATLVNGQDWAELCDAGDAVAESDGELAKLNEALYRLEEAASMFNRLASAVRHSA